MIDFAEIISLLSEYLEKGGSKSASASSPTVLLGTGANYCELQNETQFRSFAVKARCAGNGNLATPSRRARAYNIFASRNIFKTRALVCSSSPQLPGVVAVDIFKAAWRSSDSNCTHAGFAAFVNRITVCLFRL